MPVINDEWELTGDKLQGRGSVSYYSINCNRLTETANSPYSGELYDWPVQIAQKVNFDYALFVEAYRAALAHFAGQYEPPVDANILEASIKRGQQFDQQFEK